MTPPSRQEESPPKARHAKWIGLTGGVASGKSAVAELLERAGVTVINLDAVGRDLTDSSPEVLAELRRLCGDDIVQDGKLDRLRVRDRLFGDAGLRARIEAFLHPRIWNEYQRRAAEAERRGEKVIVCEAALLMESGLDRHLDGLILVTAPEEVRRDRVMARDHITQVLAEKMIRAQLRDIERNHSSTVVIENHGSLAELSLKVQDLLESWRAQGWLAG